MNLSVKRCLRRPLHWRASQRKRTRRFRDTIRRATLRAQPSLSIRLNSYPYLAIQNIRPLPSGSGTARAKRGRPRTERPMWYLGWSVLRSGMAQQEPAADQGALLADGPDSANSGSRFRLVRNFPSTLREYGNPPANLSITNCRRIRDVLSRTYWYKLPLAVVENSVMPLRTVGGCHAANRRAAQKARHR